MKRVYKADVRRDTACGSCGTDYFYFDAIEVDDQNTDDFDAKILKEIQEGTGVVPCPKCGKMSKAMKSKWMKDGLYMLLGALACLGGLVLMVVVLDGGVLLWGLGLLCLLGLAGCTLGLLAWPLTPWLGKDEAILPGEEDRAKPGARKKYEAWLASRAAGQA